jgi:excisionase family DNA binding protein
VSSNVIPLARRDPASTRDGQPGRPAAVVPITRAAGYSAAEVAGMLSISLATTYRLMRSGDIPANKTRGRWTVPKRRFHTWLDNLPEASVEDIDREMWAAQRKDHQ